MGTYTVTLSPTGTAGSATATGETEIVHGFVTKIIVKFLSAQAAGTVITISESIVGVSSTMIAMTSADGSTAIVSAPSKALYDSTNTAITQYVPPFVAGRRLTVAASSANAVANSILVYIETA